MEFGEPCRGEFGPYCRNYVVKFVLTLDVCMQQFAVSRGLDESMVDTLVSEYDVDPWRVERHSPQRASGVGDLCQVGVILLGQMQRSQF